MRGLFFNVWFSFYYSISGWLPYARIKHPKNLNRKEAVIVSLTTKPSRVHKVWLVVESMLRQRCKPDAIILYLPVDEFKDENSLPSNLHKLKERGLQLVFVPENLKPHNKYIYAMEAYPNANIVTVDDDKIYPTDLIEKLKKGHKRFPDSICAIMTRCIKLKKNIVEPYIRWDILKDNSGPSHSLVSLGVCGVLFPSRSLHQDLFHKDILKEKALVTDDLWIKIMALKNNTPVVSLAGSYDKSFISVRGSHYEQLTTVNVAQGKNDIVFNSLLAYYNIDLEQIFNSPLAGIKENTVSDDESN